MYYTCYLATIFAVEKNNYMIDHIYKNKTRLLTLDNAPEILTILEGKSKVSKVDKIDLPTESWEVTVTETLVASNKRVIGYFENGKLVSFLVQSIGRHIPVWHMMILGTSSSAPWNYKKNGLEYCWANAMNYAETLGLYKIYWCLPTHWARTQDRTICTSDVWKRYDIYIEDVILPYEYPMWEDQKVSFGKYTKPHLVTVKLGMLKNEFRTFNQKI